MTEPRWYEAPHKIEYYETDLTGQTTLAMLINMLVLTSYDQADHFGVGTDYMLENGQGWVIAQYEIDVTRLPRDHERVTLATEATSNNRYFAYRQFFMRDEAGELLVHVKSICVVMDQAARKMVAIPAAAIAPYESDEVKRIPRLARPTSIDEQMAVISQPYQVRYFDLDTNHHVNNAHYFDWMMDPLGEDFLTTHALAHVAIRFENEVRYGHEIKSVVTVPVVHDDGTITTLHRIEGDGERYAEAEFTWRGVNKD
ncbi:acyl-[acyl-carrier-protein] thioesterase [Furfurilactobacillus sp. WILCCON 0119]|uniref:acyl-[acyl-carrier-protein] thioesterase n=1 Tax=Furfurilactobacillus entadae TaxID=2922307 RepID=UPI0035E83057